MKNIVVIFGGKSVEHDISIITAMQTIANFPSEYKMLPIYVTEDGKFVTSENLTNPEIYLNFTKKVKKMREIGFNLGKNEIFILKNNKIKSKIKVDCALICMHGHGGEDGSLQGLLELCGIPYTSPSLPSSAITMDKVLTKKFLISEHIDTPAYEQFSTSEYKKNKKNVIEKISEKISFPCVVKPARLGSSVGISICSCEDMLAKAIEDAFEFDNKIIVEKFINEAREFCCAAVRCDDKVYLSHVKEVNKNKIYTFEQKYLNNQNSAEQNIEAKLEDKIKKLCKRVYEALDLDGVVRIDFLYSEKERKLYVNEPNSVPGSLAFDMFDGKFADLQKLIIESAIKKSDEKKKINYCFNSVAIQKYIDMAFGSKFKK